jgi:hypothetical protein
MLSYALRTSVFLLVLPLVTAASMAIAATDAPDTILVRRGDATITRADWDAELLRIPEKDRADFAASPRRNGALLERMLTTRELALRAREKKLDADPVTRLRIRQEEERILAAAYLASVEESAAADFERRRPAFERRARELYEVDRTKYETPETAMITLLFFSAGKDGIAMDAAQKRANAALAKIKAGADIGNLAASESDDTTTREVRGRKGPLARSDLYPPLANAVFALKAKGDMTEVIHTNEGFFLVRLDERRPPVQQSFDKVEPAIMAELKQAQMSNAREAALANVGAGAAIEVNRPAVDALRTAPAH